MNNKFPNTILSNANQNQVNYKSISELGCQVSTGNIVWNQWKDKLVSNPYNPINNKLNHIIIYSHNIRDNIIQLVNEDEEKDTNSKRQYYKNESIEPSINNISSSSGAEAEETSNKESNFVGLTPPIILVNRIMGSHNKKIKAVLITKDTLKLPHFKTDFFAAENHLNIISVLGSVDYKIKEKN